MTDNQEVTIDAGDSFKTILSKYGALALDKQENLAELINDLEGDLDIENGILSFNDLKLPIQVIGFYTQDLNQWSWAWDSEEIFGKDLIKIASEIKNIGNQFNIDEFTNPVLNATYDDCHTLAMTTTSLFDMDAYYAVNEDDLDIFVAVKSDLIGKNNDVEKFRNTFYTFQKNFDIYPKIAFESYTKLKGYGFKRSDEFDVAKIGENRIIVGYTQRGSVTHIQML